MDVILLERVAKLGQMGDVVKVKNGFARNYLLPQGKALRATKENLARFETERAQLEARNLELKKEAEGVAGKLNGQSFVVIRQAGDSGQLYGSVSTRDIADAITAGGFSIERRQVMLDRPIKTLGLHDLRIGLHPEVEADIIVNVARTEDEAERQARGENVTAGDEDEILDEVEDGAPQPDEVFEEGAETALVEGGEVGATADEVSDDENAA